MVFIMYFIKSIYVKQIKKIDFLFLILIIENIIGVYICTFLEILRVSALVCVLLLVTKLFRNYHSKNHNIRSHNIFHREVSLITLYTRLNKISMFQCWYVLVKK